MNLLRNTLIGFGGSVLLAMVIAMAAPRAVQAVVSTLVTVANTSSNPVPVDNSAEERNSIALVGSLQIEEGTAQGTASFVEVHHGSAYVVPAGKRFVVDNVNVNASVIPGVTPSIAMFLNEGSGGTYVYYSRLSLQLPGVPIPAGGGTGLPATYTGGEKVRLFEDPGGSFSVFLQRMPALGSANANVFIVGHLIDCGSGCAGQ